VRFTSLAAACVLVDCGAGHWTLGAAGICEGEES
jgi:hypothetical protein